MIEFNEYDVESLGAAEIARLQDVNTMTDEDLVEALYDRAWNAGNDENHAQDERTIQLKVEIQRRMKETK